MTLRKAALVLCLVMCFAPIVEAQRPFEWGYSDLTVTFLGPVQPGILGTLGVVSQWGPVKGVDWFLPCRCATKTQPRKLTLLLQGTGTEDIGLDDDFTAGRLDLRSIQLDGTDQYIAWIVNGPVHFHFHNSLEDNVVVSLFIDPAAPDLPMPTHPHIIP